MNVQTAYNQVKAGTLNKDSFLFEAFRDSRLNKCISKSNTFEDVVNIFKSKGYIQDESAVVPKFDFLNSIATLKENMDFNVPDRKKVEMDVNHVNYYEFQKGWRYELKGCKGDIEKAKAKAIKNLNTDDIFYTRLEMGTKKTDKRDDLPINLSKKGASDKDEQRQMKPVKGVEKHKSNNSEKSSDPKASKNPKGVGTMKKAYGPTKVIGKLQEAMMTRSDLAKFADDSDKKKVAETKAFKVNPKYTHFAVDKATNKILDAWEYPKDYTPEDIKPYLKSDLADRDIKPSDIKLLTVKGCKAKGIDPFNWDSWKKDVEPTEPDDKKIDEADSAESHFKDIKKKYANQANPAVISFTFKDPTKGNEVVQYEGRVKEIVKSKTPGAYVLKMQDGASVATMKDNAGKPVVVYMSKDGKDPVKNPDINNDDEKIFDDILGIQSTKQSVDEQVPILGENDIASLKESIKTLVRKHLKEYADGEKDEYDSIEDEYGTPEILDILKKYDNLGFDIPGEAINAILTDKEWKDIFDFENNQEDISKIAAWRDGIVKKKKVSEDTTSVDATTGPKVKLKRLKHELRNMDWAALNGDNNYQKQNQQDRLNIIKQLVDQLGDEAKSLYNDAAPGEFKLTEENQVHQEIKDLEDMRPEDIADMVIAQDFDPNSIKTKAAALLIGHALKDKPNDDKLKQAFLKLSGLIKKK